MVNYKNKITKINFILVALALLASVVAPLFSIHTVSAAPAITITSPTANQQISGTNFTVKGTATPNSSVVISNNNISFAQTISDAQGNWSATGDLAAGPVKVTARVIQNPDYGYFSATALDFNSTDINRIRLSDFSINPDGGGWPFNPSALPEKFDASNPAEPIPATGTFPNNPTINKGDFNITGTKYYVGSISSTNNVVSVVDVPSNSHITDINVGGKPVTVWTAPNGKIFVAMSANMVKVINPDNDIVEKTINIACNNPESVTNIGFSRDLNYPYYYVPCSNDGTVMEMKFSDGSLNKVINTGGSPVTLALSLDNKRMFVSNLVGSSDKKKLNVFSTNEGSLIQSINLTAGAFGFIATPDLQKILIATPENLVGQFNFDVQNIDIIDTSTYQKSSIPTDGFPATVSFSNSEITSVDVDVSFVLGATTTVASGTLAETGTLAISAILLLGIIIGIMIYLYSDYRKHKKPLIEINPNVHYTFAHHVKMVNIPLMRYRLTIKMTKKHNNLISR